MSPLSLLDRGPGAERRTRRRDGEGARDAERGADPRIVARREEVREERRARRRRWGLIVSIAVAVVAVIYGASRSALFDLDHIEVAGTERTSYDDVVRAAGLRDGQPLTEVDVDAATAALQALPWVRTATVERSWSGTVAITVAERNPLVVIQDGDRVVLVDEERRVLAVVPEVPAWIVPVRGVPAADPGATADPRLDGAIAVVRALGPGVRSRIAAVEVVGEELVLQARPQGSVRFGTVDRLDDKVVALTTIFGQVDLDGLCTVDLRVPDAPVLTPRGRCA